VSTGDLESPQPVAAIIRAAARINPSFFIKVLSPSKFDLESSFGWNGVVLATA
jgi:hypothetical protein